jgi:hypothetical protein
MNGFRLVDFTTDLNKWLKIMILLKIDKVRVFVGVRGKWKRVGIVGERKTGERERERDVLI